MPLDDDRGLEKGWVYGALRVRDGQVLTQTVPARNTAGYLALLTTLDQTDAQGDRSLIADNLSRHTSGPIRDWLAAHPRFQHAFIPSGAAGLHLIEGWWRLFRRQAFAGVSVANAADIASVTHLHRDGSAQSPRPTLGLGASTAATPPPAAAFRLSLLRNDAWNYLKRVELKNCCCADLAELHIELRRAKERLRHKHHIIRSCSTHCGYSV